MTKPVWPKDSQSTLAAFYGQPGSAVSNQLVKVVPPFKMYYAGKQVPYLMFHKKAAPALERALKTVWEYYGRDQAKMDKLGISKTAGTYNHRKIAGSNNWSNHAFGAAIDINAAENGFNMAGNIPIPMVAAFKAEGARWGGDYKGRTDPMHFEFVDNGLTDRTFSDWLKFYGVQNTNPVLPPDVNPILPQTPPPNPIKPRAFEESLELLFASEGGYTNDPNDNGGPTNFGITLNDYRQYIDHDGSAADVRAMKIGEAKKIYKEAYWNRVNADALPPGVDYAMFDFGVNSGTGMVKKLQSIVGVTPDGIIGPNTLAAIRKRDPVALINRLCDVRMDYLRGLSDWKHFGTGWTNRVTRVRRDAIQMAQDAAATGEVG